MADQLSEPIQPLVDAVCRRYRSWEKHLCEAPVPGKVLSGGFNHHVQLLESQSQRFVLRINCDGERNAGQCQQETTIQKHAAARDIAPHVVFSDANLRLMVMDYVEASSHEPRGHKEGLARLVSLLHTIHDLPPLGTPVHSSDVLRRYLAMAPGFKTQLDAHMPLILSLMGRIDNTRGNHRKLCHNDLLAANRIFSGDRLYALDWEYAAPGDPVFDLAVCASEMRKDEAENLLGLYLQQAPTAAQAQHFAGQCLIYQCIEACWFHVHHPHSGRAKASMAALSRELKGWSAP